MDFNTVFLYCKQNCSILYVIKGSGSSEVEEKKQKRNAQL